MERPQVTRVEIAEVILQVMPVSGLRKEVRRRHTWASAAYPGFRADSLTREIIVRAAPRFAANTTLLNELVLAYLESLGFFTASSVAEGLTEAASGSEQFSERLRLLVADLRGRSLEDLPLKAELFSGPDPETASSAAAVAEHQRRPVRGPIKADGRQPTAKATEIECDSAPEGTQGSAPPAFLSERVFLVWEPPEDDIEEAQKTVTLFGRSLTAFVRRQLEGAHGERWFRVGCPKDVRETLKEKATKEDGRSTVIPPSSLIGYAELGDLFKIILAGQNWKFFEPYFGTREELTLRTQEIIGLRISAMHPEDRQIAFLPNVAKFSAMARIAEAYDPITSRAISDVCQSLVGANDDAELLAIVGDKLFTNLGSLRDPQLSGRELELGALERYWRDPFARVVSVSGAGGVGKTALIHQFISNLLQQPCSPGMDPDPFALVYLTAKNNYLPGFHVPDPDSMRFGSLREVIDSTIGLGLDGDRGASGTDAEGRRRCLEIAEAFRVLFVLDNLETLSQEAAREIYEFVSAVPRPSKVILTSRVGREAGTPMVLKGLPKEDAMTLLERRLAAHGDALENHDPEQVDRIIDYSQGFPMTIVHCANLIGRSGYTAAEAMEKLRGATMLEFLEFSFGSSIETLDPRAFRMLAALSFSPSGRSRKELERVVGSQEALDEVLYDLTSISFIERMPDMKKTPTFRIASEQLRDYVNSLARRRLSDAEFAGLRGAGLPLTHQASPSLDVEVERALRNAHIATSSGWKDALLVVEGAIAKWGEDPRLLAKAGYYHFRMLQRRKAVDCLEAAIRLGSDSPSTFTDLAIVLIHERDYDVALKRAETALAMDPGNPLANQLIAQSLIQTAERGQLTLSDSRRMLLLERAVRHAQDSLIADERSHTQRRHNELSRQWISRAESGLKSLRTLTQNV